MTQKQMDAVKVLEDAHREQDESHKHTAQRHKEIMGMIAKAKEGVSCRRNVTAGRGTSR